MRCRHHRKAASGAAATRLKCPVDLATSTGPQANTAPASHASIVAPSVTRRASTKVIQAVSTTAIR